MQFVRFLGIALLAGCVSLPALAGHGKQGKNKDSGGANSKPAPPPKNPPPGKANKANPPKNNVNPEVNQARGALMGMPPKWLEQLRTMTPQQQERFFQNNDRFKTLPPERQEQIRRQFQKWNSLTPEQQQRVLRAGEIWNKMSPEQQRYFVQDLGPRFQQLPTERKQTIQRHLRALDGLSDADRNAKLDDPNFTRGLSPDEQKMLRELSNLRAGDVPDPPGENPF
jgi:hypothetical protein